MEKEGHLAPAPGRMLSVLSLSSRLLLGMVLGLLPTMLILLANWYWPPVWLTVPALMAAYVSFLGRAFVAPSCLLRPAQRTLGVGMTLGVVITVALYVAVLHGATGRDY